MHHRLIPTLGKAEKRKKRPPNVGKLRKSVKTAFPPREKIKNEENPSPQPEGNPNFSSQLFGCFERKSYLCNR